MRRRSLLQFSACIGALDAILPKYAHASLIPPFFLDCVVALGYSGPGLQNGTLVPRVWHTIGTGFFYGHLVKNDPDLSKRLYNTFLVTAAHVVDGYAKLQVANPSIGPMKIRVNPVDTTGGGTEFDLLGEVADNGAMWVRNPHGKDVTVLSMNLGMLRDKKFESAFFASDLTVADINKLKSLGVSAGDGIFVLGFPMDMAGAQKNYVIARQGAMARVGEMLDRASDSFLIDSFVFPGNSGGPVILRPEFLSITGTTANTNAYLIGVVIESIDYVDTAISAQTGHPRVSFEENAGLGKVLPTDYIEEAIAVAIAAAAPADTQRQDHPK